MNESVHRKLYRLERDDAVGEAVRATAREARNELIETERRIDAALDVFSEHWPNVEHDADLAAMTSELFAMKNAIHENLTLARAELREREVTT